ncbi:MAG: hypothetical protein JNM76_07135 [Betaproteobacteria bacterium]|nr:hypothetical protein [Betaproteobacteria bacterium]
MGLFSSEAKVTDQDRNYRNARPRGAGRSALWQVRLRRLSTPKIGTE